MLTVRGVESAKPKDKAYKLADNAGLYLYVAPTGTKSWRANYTRQGKQATRTYGQWPALSLADARKAHAAARDAIAAPIVAAVPTFREVAQAWLKIKLPTLSNGKHQIQVGHTLERFAYPTLGKRGIDTITRADLVAVVQAVQATGVIETAHRVAGRITAVFDYAQDVGLLQAHPASGLVRVLQSRKTQKPMASIPAGEAGAPSRPEEPARGLSCRSWRCCAGAGAVRHVRSRRVLSRAVPGRRGRRVGSRQGRLLLLARAAGCGRMPGKNESFASALLRPSEDAALPAGRCLPK